jgi:cytochrome c556
MIGKERRAPVRQRILILVCAALTVGFGAWLGVGVGEVGPWWPTAAGTPSVWADEDHGHADDLPAGPIHDRHELMESIGDNAKIIVPALRSGDAKAIPEPALEIAGLATRIPSLFPKGSTHPKSRAKPEIWERFAEFEALSKKLEQRALALAKAAEAGADLKEPGEQFMKTCKGCHEAFRVPKDEKTG